MKNKMMLVHTGLGVALVFTLLCMGPVVQAQMRMTIQATAMGTSTQMGRIANINIHIQQLSTEDDRKTLIAAFKRSGHDGLVDALQHMDSKGRVRFASGGVGNDVNYIIELPAKDGARRFRLVTDRYLSFNELYNSPRSEQYSVGAIELTLTPDGKGSGTLLPACRIRLDKKKKQVEIESFQNPWNLTNLMVSND
jgi:hypothetical protein